MASLPCPQSLSAYNVELIGNVPREEKLDWAASDIGSLRIAGVRGPGTGSSTTGEPAHRFPSRSEVSHLWQLRHIRARQLDADPSCIFSAATTCGEGVSV